MHGMASLESLSFDLKGFHREYSLVAVFVVVLLLKRTVREWAKLYAFRDVEHSADKKVLTWDTLAGPSRLPIIGSLHHLRDLKNTMKMFRDFGERFGPVIRFSIFHEQFVVLNDAEVTQALIQSTDVEHCIKSTIFYDLALTDIVGNGILTSMGAHWKSHRRILNPAFSFKSFQNYIKLFNRYSTKLVQELEALFANSNETKTLNSTIHLCTMQIISEAVMGLDLCNDEDGKAFYDSVRRSKEIFGIRLAQTHLLFNPIWRRSSLYKEYQQILSTIKTISRRMIALKRKKLEDMSFNSPTQTEINDDVTKGRTMIEEMLRAGMTDAEILDEVITMIFAGFETTGAATHFLMFLLALNPEHQKMCRDEVDAIMADPMKYPEGELTYDGIGDLKHTERCLFEGLRLFPPIFAFGRKLENPLKLSDTLTLPKGTNAFFGPITIHVNPNYFPDPYKFDPDRFLPENVKQRHPYAFIPFSSGPRNCIGSKFAIMAAKTMSAQILRNFEVITTDKMGDVRLLPNIFCTPERDYNFILKRRITSSV